MPQFILDHGTQESAKAFRALDTFTQGYIEAMFFTDTERNSVREAEPDSRDRQWNPETDSSLPGDVSVADLASETLTRIIADCEQFQTANAALLERAYTLGEAQDCYDETTAGRDLWYTRNGHGCGFWDRGLGDVGQALTALCGHGTAFHGVDSYLGDDGLIYLS
jgi:hypothetical protein